MKKLFRAKKPEKVLIIAETRMMGHHFCKVMGLDPKDLKVDTNSVRGHMVDRLIVVGTVDENLYNAARPCIAGGGREERYVRY